MPRRHTLLPSSRGWCVCPSRRISREVEFWHGGAAGCGRRAGGASRGHSSPSTSGPPRRSSRGCQHRAVRVDNPICRVLPSRGRLPSEVFMERKDEELIVSLLEREPELRHYYEEHADLDKPPATLQPNPY